ncbi:protein-associating with the carboxyl-terminal domain of ezrin [Drosophila grimshawi]|uniref:GH13294 n=1 Tax=Drosophila grimshawi TaxID=7222 RepID=B4JQ14_DROGR|nr:protein-associating with the carboxyl-terminal domain of ezrin [Drosophila grimshawi]EDV98994.1 GH13294 [Drosophila grimshawi]
MGNEGSKLKGLIIDKNAIEVNDFWALYNAESPTTCNEEGGGGQLLSIFKGEVLVKGQLWAAQGPMERAIRNLMIYRHPYILKYMSTWDQSGQKHLATERVRPLSDVLTQQSDIQVCLGLRTILCSLIFLIERAHARHLNICTQSVYVTDKGSWRLAGFEYVWKAKELNKQLIELAHSFRQPLAMDAADTTQLALEQFAFAALCEQILDKCGGSAGIPHVLEFRDYCSTHLKHQNIELRPKLSAVLLHPYFNHEFILIHSFLFELPLKSVPERQQFFSSLIERLRGFDEQVVASQLASDLLSRMVLLDPTAQHCVTPFVLRTKTENGCTAPLFSPQTYVQHLLPHVLKMFRLRDAQIRLILLDYFMEYVRLLSDEQLLNDILPHLQLGMSDTNDVLVAKTLRSMADLVPILGAATVLGGDRRRCFSDGRPHAAVSTDSSAQWTEPRSITPLMNGSAADAVDYMVSGSPLPLDSNVVPPMPLRLSPDGGEDDKSITQLSEKPLESSHSNSLVDNNSDSSTSSAAHEQTLVNINDDDDEEEELAQKEDEEEEEEEAAWSDWDNAEELQRLQVKQQSTLDELNLYSNVETTSSTSTQATQPSSIADSFRTACSSLSTATLPPPPPPAPLASASSNRKVIDDLSALDIQVQLTTSLHSSEPAEFDFFKDMEPVIETKPATGTGAAASEAEIVQIDASRFAAALTSYNGPDTDVEADQGWGHDDDEDDDVVWGNNGDATNTTTTTTPTTVS